MRGQKLMNKVRRIFCTLIAICILSSVPAVSAKAAVVETGIDVSKWQGAIKWHRAVLHLLLFE